MFKNSDDHRQLDTFSSSTEYFKDSMKNYYIKNESWHNQFRKQVVIRVDETVFSVLYIRGKAAHNASLRVLVGMMIYLFRCNLVEYAREYGEDLF